jgi:hypothetical protein
MPKAAVGIEKWQRHGTIDRRLHAIGAQMRGELIAPGVPDGVEVIDVGAIGADLRHDHVFDLNEAGIVVRGLGRSS